MAGGEEDRGVAAEREPGERALVVGLPVALHELRQLRREEWLPHGAPADAGALRVALAPEGRGRGRHDDQCLDGRGDPLDIGLGRPVAVLAVAAVQQIQGGERGGGVVRERRGQQDADLDGPDRGRLDRRSRVRASSVSTLTIRAPSSAAAADRGLAAQRPRGGIGIRTRPRGRRCRGCTDGEDGATPRGEGIRTRATIGEPGGRALAHRWSSPMGGPRTPSPALECRGATGCYTAVPGDAAQWRSATGRRTRRWRRPGGPVSRAP